MDDSKSAAFQVLRLTGVVTAALVTFVVTLVASVLAPACVAIALPVGPVARTVAPLVCPPSTRDARAERECRPHPRGKGGALCKTELLCASPSGEVTRVSAREVDAAVASATVWPIVGVGLGVGVALCLLINFAVSRLQRSSRRPVRPGHPG